MKRVGSKKIVYGSGERGSAEGPKCHSSIPSHPLVFVSDGSCQGLQRAKTVSISIIVIMGTGGSRYYARRTTHLSKALCSASPQRLQFRTFDTTFEARAQLPITTQDGDCGSAPS